MNIRVLVGLSIATVATAAGCGHGGGGATNDAASTTSVHHQRSHHSGDQAVVATTTQAPAPTPGCQTKDLSLTLGQGGGAAGSVYEPLRLTNMGGGTCTLFGYPGVSFVTAGSGEQVGAAASRNPQHSALTVTLAPGASAESVVQVVNHENYSPSQCKAADVSGFRVYPPGNKAAAYVPFDQPSSACTTDVTQLTVEAVTSATS